MLASLYNYLYHIIVIILTFSVMASYSRWRPVNVENNQSKITPSLFIAALFFILAIGLRPISYVFVDMMAYYLDYEALVGQPYEFTLETDNFLFDNILPWFAANGIPISLYYLLVATIYIGCIAIACKKIFPCS